MRRRTRQLYDLDRDTVDDRPISPITIMIALVLARSGAKPVTS